MKRENKKWSLVLLPLLGISLATAIFFAYQSYQLQEQKLIIESELAKSRTDSTLLTKDLNDTINSLSQELLQTKNERDDFRQRYEQEKSRLDLLSFQISDIKGEVGLLEKLNEIDPELLQKYSKVYFLNENYVPKTLVKIDSEYTYDPKKEYQFYEKTWPFLEDLLSAAAGANVDLKIISAYRSFNEQAGIKSTYKMLYGSGANQFSSDQGYSEHQLGTTVDFTTEEIGASFTNFQKTAAYQWLLENASRYGFILSYPENNSYYQFEPWHWRFVGRNLAGKLQEENKHFYDLSQREIDEYLASFLN